MQPRSHTFMVGSIECTVLLDGTSILGKQGMARRFPHVAEADIRNAYLSLGKNLDTADDYFNILLLKIGEEVVLVDSGEGGNPKGGQVVESMAHAGIAPEDVTLIVITHAHGDHILGLLSNDNKSVFPNAKYVITRPEMEYWRKNLDSAVSEQTDIVNMIESQGVRLIEMNEQILPGLTAVPLPGHTPGHIAVQVKSGTEKLQHMADLLISPIQFEHPEWSPVFDRDTGTSVPTRLETLQRAADEGLLCLFYHMPFPGLGFVKRTEDSFAWQPIGS